MGPIARQRVIRFILNMNAVCTPGVDRGMLEDLLNSYSDDSLQDFAEIIVRNS